MAIIKAASIPSLSEMIVGVIIMDVLGLIINYC